MEEREIKSQAITNPKVAERWGHLELEKNLKGQKNPPRILLYFMVLEVQVVKLFRIILKHYSFPNCLFVQKFKHKTKRLWASHFWKKNAKQKNFSRMRENILKICSLQHQFFSPKNSLIWILCHLWGACFTVCVTTAKQQRKMQWRATSGDTFSSVWFTVCWRREHISYQERTCIQLQHHFRSQGTEIAGGLTAYGSCQHLLSIKETV